MQQTIARVYQKGSRTQAKHKCRRLQGGEWLERIPCKSFDFCGKRTSRVRSFVSPLVAIQNSATDAGFWFANKDFADVFTSCFTFYLIALPSGMIKYSSQTSYLVQLVPLTLTRDETNFISHSKDFLHNNYLLSKHLRHSIE